MGQDGCFEFGGALYYGNCVAERDSPTSECCSETVTTCCNTDPSALGSAGRSLTQNGHRGVCRLQCPPCLETTTAAPCPCSSTTTRPPSGCPACATQCNCLSTTTTTTTGCPACATAPCPC